MEENKIESQEWTLEDVRQKMIDYLYKQLFYSSQDVEMMKILFEYESNKNTSLNFIIGDKAFSFNKDGLEVINAQTVDSIIEKINKKDAEVGNSII